MKSQKSIIRKSLKAKQRRKDFVSKRNANVQQPRLISVDGKLRYNPLKRPSLIAGDGVLPVSRKFKKTASVQ